MESASGRNLDQLNMISDPLSVPSAVWNMLFASWEQNGDGALLGELRKLGPVWEGIIDSYRAGNLNY